MGEQENPHGTFPVPEGLAPVLARRCLFCAAMPRAWEGSLCAGVLIAGTLDRMAGLGKNSSLKPPLPSRIHQSPEVLMPRSDFISEPSSAGPEVGAQVGVRSPVAPPFHSR